MSLLKIIVIAMAAPILLGTLLLVWMLLHRQTGGLHRDAAPVAAAAAPAAPAAGGGTAGYFAANVPIPAGMHFEQMLAVGNHVLLRFAGDQGQRILMVDPESGSVTGSIALTPEH